MYERGCEVKVSDNFSVGAFSNPRRTAKTARSRSRYLKMNYEGQGNLFPARIVDSWWHAQEQGPRYYIWIHFYFLRTNSFNNRNAETWVNFWQMRNAVKCPYFNFAMLLRFVGSEDIHPNERHREVFFKCWFQQENKVEFSDDNRPLWKVPIYTSDFDRVRFIF